MSWNKNNTVEYYSSSFTSYGNSFLLHIPWLNKNTIKGFRPCTGTDSTEQECNISHLAEVLDMPFQDKFPSGTNIFKVSLKSHCEMLKNICRILSNQCIISYQYCTIWHILFKHLLFLEHVLNFWTHSISEILKQSCIAV